MSIENLSQLESKIQNAIDTIGLQKMEIDELREQNAQLQAEKQRLQEEQQAWNSKIQGLLGQLDQVSEGSL